MRAPIVALVLFTTVLTPGCNGQAQSSSEPSPSAIAEAVARSRECASWMALRNSDHDKVEALRTAPTTNLASLADALEKERHDLEASPPRNDDMLKQLADTYVSNLKESAASVRSDLGTSKSDGARDGATLEKMQGLHWGLIADHCRKLSDAADRR